MEFKCECCEYITSVKCNYKKHINSASHIKKINGIEDKDKETVNQLIERLNEKIKQQSKLIMVLREDKAEIRGTMEYFQKLFEEAEAKLKRQNSFIDNLNN